jgi:hypothetical protein
MRNYFKILLLIVLTTFFACSERKLTDDEIQSKALKLTSQIDKSSIETFKNWNLQTRGNAEIWSKISFEDNDYSCTYLKYNDTTRIIIGSFENFQKDFPYSIDIDSTRYFRAIFFKFNQTKIKVLVTDKNGKDTILNKETELKKVFKKSDPFIYFNNLSKLKDSLGIIRSLYRPDIGDFIQFYLSPENVLTYMPEKLNLNPKYKDVWLKEFAKGKIIKRNWNLRKLERPIDNG